MVCGIGVKVAGFTGRGLLGMADDYSLMLHLSISETGTRMITMERQGYEPVRWKMTMEIQSKLLIILRTDVILS